MYEALPSVIATHLISPCLGREIDGRGQAVVGPVDDLLLDGRQLGDGFVGECLVRQRPHGQAVHVPAILSRLQHRHLVHGPVRVAEHILKNTHILVVGSSGPEERSFVSWCSCLWFHLACCG